MGPTKPWTVPPLLPGGWRDVAATDAAPLAARIAAAAASNLGFRFDDVELSRMRVLPLPFYERTLLVEFEGLIADGRVGVGAALYGPQRRVVMLDYTGGSIHSFNSGQRPVAADRAAAALYLVFFSAAMRGELGRFRILQSAADVPTDTAALSADQRALLAPIAPIDTQKFEQANGHWQATLAAHVLYGTTLFRAQFRIVSGVVEMSEEENLAEIPVFEETFHGPLRVPTGRLMQPPSDRAKPNTASEG
jgi:hypothetical protein